jgi:hypothetical protein
MNKGDHCCMDKPECLSVVLMEGVEQLVACGDMKTA